MPFLTRRNLLTLTAAAGASTVMTIEALGAPPPPAAAAGGVTGSSPTRGGVLNGSAPSLHPEGIAWDPTRKAFLVSSMRHGTVSVVHPDGTVGTLISDPRMVSTLGVRVDARRRRVLVAFADLGVAERSAPGTVFQSSGLGIFDLATGRVQHHVPLTGIPGGHLANDIAVDHSGNAYVTDTASDGVYRVDPAGRADVLVRDPRLTGPTGGLNGIVRHPDGFLLAVHHTTGELWRIGTDGSLRPVELDQPLVGGDGLALLPSGALVVVTNSLLTAGRNAVQTCRGGRRWNSARVVDRSDLPGAPSTVAVSPRGVHVLDGALDGLIQQGITSDSFTIRRYR
ncbi:MAG TPA: SMP-30/gluconolactonase/LRE family protein [Actinoplanes sp.]|jgi:DNA-binding beta-propeller fold protein YncE